jgi:hypothetical protein
MIIRATANEMSHKEQKKSRKQQEEAAEVYV